MIILNQTQQDATVIPPGTTRGPVSNFLRGTTPRDLWLALGLLVFGLAVTLLAWLTIKMDAGAARADRILTQASEAAAPIKKTVLVIFPYQIDQPAHMIAAQAIREEFGNATDLGLDVYYEYSDINRFSDPAYQQQLFDLYAAKYQSKPIDLVIVSSETMLNLWLGQREIILSNVPIVFFDINIERLDGLKLPSDVTGVSGVDDYTKSVQWVLDKLPTINEIVIVHGVGQAEQEYIQPVLILQEKMKGQITFIDLSSLPLPVIKQRVAALPKTSIVLYHLMFQDADGNRYRPIDVLRELTAVSAVPVISGYDLFIGTGTIGGYMYSIDHQARDAAQIGLRILRGEAVGSIPIVKDQSNSFIFDQLALQKFGIPLSALPPDSIIKNRQYSVWELYRLQIIIVIVVFVVLLLLVAFLMVTTRRLNTARLDLIGFNAALETRVQERTLALSQTNHDLELEISERKQAEQALQDSHDLLEQHVQERTAELRAANLDLEKAVRMKDEFLAAMSHELRTPLTGIMGLSEVMQMSGSDPLTEKQRTHLALIHNSGQHLLEMVNDILDFSSIGSGKFDLDLVSCSLEEICQSSLRKRLAQADAKHLQHNFSMSPSHIMVSADVRRLQKIFLNLLDNAVKFTPQGGSFGIEVLGDASEKQVRITVWDTGIGIKDEDLPRMFQPFVQLDARLARQYNGTGLGLALVRRLSELHGGSVSVQSVVGQGSRFTVTLPWQPASVSWSNPGILWDGVIP